MPLLTITGQDLWHEMTERAQTDNLIGTNYKKLNLPFETKMMSQPKNIRGRIVDRVAEFVFHLLVDVFNARDTAPLAMEAILEANGPDPGDVAERIEDPCDWTHQKIVRHAAQISSDKGPDGDFDD